MISTPLLVLFVVSSAPSSEKVLLEQAQRLMATDTARARRTAERCVTVHPGASKCWLVLASACAKTKPADEVCARRAYARFIELEPPPKERAGPAWVDWP